MLELKLLKQDEFEIFLKELDDFNIIGENKFSNYLKNKFESKYKKYSNNIVITEDDPTDVLQTFIHKTTGVIVAKKGKKYFKNKPLFLISIPKAGTHLLFELIKEFGYQEGGYCTETPKGGHWYFIEFTNTHTSAKHFFNDTVYKSDFGNRNHPFVTSPAIFIYRNPLDIVCSEANYYHKKGKTSFYNYLSNLNYNERLSKLINDKWLLGSIRDRISNFIAWLYFNNVISVSFEELIGPAGGGDDKIQEKLIWSLQLKLQIPGIPQNFAKKIFNQNSETFFKGQINSYKQLFLKEHYEKFKNLEQDFMEELGYTINSNSLFSKKIDYFLNKPLEYDDNLNFPPILKKSDVNGFNIVLYNHKFYAIPQKLGPIDLEKDDLDESIIISDNYDNLLWLIKRNIK